MHRGLINRNRPPRRPLLYRCGRRKIRANPHHLFASLPVNADHRGGWRGVRHSPAPLHAPNKVTPRCAESQVWQGKQKAPTGLRGNAFIAGPAAMFHNRARDAHINYAGEQVRHQYRHQ